MDKHKQGSMPSNKIKEKVLKIPRLIVSFIIDYIIDFVSVECCPVCGCAQADDSLCLNCRTGMPLTNYWEWDDNPLMMRLAGQVPIESATAFFFFVHNSPVRRAIHNIKYFNNWRLAHKLGVWYGSYLAVQNPPTPYDCIVPIPLHPARQIKRTYNQSYHIAKGIATQLEIELMGNAVIRTRNNSSQTHHKHRERADNVKGIFTVRNPKKLRGRHILVVDDVCTTGSTLISCIEAILDQVEDCRISVAVLAFAKH